MFVPFEEEADKAWEAHYDVIAKMADDANKRATGFPEHCAEDSGCVLQRRRIMSCYDPTGRGQMADRNVSSLEMLMLGNVEVRHCRFFPTCGEAMTDFLRRANMEMDESTSSSPHAGMS